ncbi:phage tail protein [Gilliamella intestini]|uniref:phage tail protein n=1 Tax=Gilliamella intestini TaxID=1798183 RepID=UPI000B844F9E
MWAFLCLEKITKTSHWKPQNSSTISISPKVKVIKFGDGYEQHIRDCINKDFRSYNVTFVELSEDISLIDDFDGLLLTWRSCRPSRSAC